jgi:hypothetical protein
MVILLEDMLFWSVDTMINETESSSWWSDILEKDSGSTYIWPFQWLEIKVDVPKQEKMVPLHTQHPWIDTLRSRVTLPRSKREQLCSAIACCYGLDRISHLSVGPMILLIELSSRVSVMEIWLCVWSIYHVWLWLNARCDIEQHSQIGKGSEKTKWGKKKGN